MTFKGVVPPIHKKVTLPKVSHNGHWEFPEEMGKGVGFVYVIYDTVLNRGYIGKKLFYGTGKLNAGKDSGWRTYVSSSKFLKDVMKERPREEFQFICLEQYQSKGTLSYSETWSLCYVEAPTTKQFYNTLIEKVSWPVKEPISVRHKDRLNEIFERIKRNVTY